MILNYKCSGNAYSEPVDTCYRIISGSYACSSSELEHQGLT